MGPAHGPLLQVRAANAGGLPEPASRGLSGEEHRKKTWTSPPAGASHSAARTRARSGSRWNRPTRTAKTRSKRRSPRSRIFGEQCDGTDPEALDGGPQSLAHACATLITPVKRGGAPARLARAWGLSSSRLTHARNRYAPACCSAVIFLVRMVTGGAGNRGHPALRGADRDHRGGTRTQRRLCRRPYWGPPVRDLGLRGTGCRGAQLRIARHRIRAGGGDHGPRVGPDARLGSARAEVRGAATSTSPTDMLCTASADGRILTANESWQRTLGWSFEELTSRTLSSSSSTPTTTR